MSWNANPKYLRYDTRAGSLCAYYWNYFNTYTCIICTLHNENHPRLFQCQIYCSTDMKMIFRATNNTYPPPYSEHRDFIARDEIGIAYLRPWRNNSSCPLASAINRNVKYTSHASIETERAQFPDSFNIVLCYTPVFLISSNKIKLRIGFSPPATPPYNMDLVRVGRAKSSNFMFEVNGFCVNKGHSIRIEIIQN